MQPEIECFFVICLMACKSGSACLTFTLLWLEGKKKVLLPSEKFMIWVVVESHKKHLSISGLKTPAGPGEGPCSRKARLHHTPTHLPAARQPTPLSLCWQLICCPRGPLALARIHLKNVLPMLRFEEERTILGCYAACCTLTAASRFPLSGPLQTERRAG